MCRNQKEFSGVFQEGTIQYHHTANRPQDDAVLPYVFITSEQHTVFLGESDSGGRKRYPAQVSGFNISPLLSPSISSLCGQAKRRSQKLRRFRFLWGFQWMQGSALPNHRQRLHFIYIADQFARYRVLNPPASPAALGSGWENGTVAQFSSFCFYKTPKNLKTQYL